MRLIDGDALMQSLCDGVDGLSEVMVKIQEAPAIHDAVSVLKEENERLRAELKEKSLFIEDRAQAEYNMEGNLRYKDGMIAGLKYALRCNGISGAEIHDIN